jgi:microcystin-dependent protein
VVPFDQAQARPTNRSRRTGVPPPQETISMDPYVGEIRLFAGDYAPEQWHICDGALLSISEYQALFALIGITFGGDGVNNFALPDLRGRLLIGAGTAPGLTPRTVGQHVGIEAATLTVADQLPHTHTLSATTAANTTDAPGPTAMLGKLVSGQEMFYANPTETTLTTFKLNTRSVTITGANIAHNNMMPCIGLSYIIALFGLFPSAA